MISLFLKKITSGLVVFGFVNEIKPITTDNGEHTLRLMIGVPIPQKGVAYIFATSEEVENMYGYKYPYEISNEEEI